MLASHAQRPGLVHPTRHKPIVVVLACNPSIQGLDDRRPSSFLERWAQLLCEPAASHTFEDTGYC